MRSLLIFRQNSVGKIVGRIFEFAYNGAKVAYNAGLGWIYSRQIPAADSWMKKSCIFFGVLLRSIKL